MKIKTKNVISTVLFVISTLCLVALVGAMVEFSIFVATIETTSGMGVVDNVLLVIFLSGFSLIVSFLGLVFSLPSAILTSIKAIRICSYIEVIVFSIVLIVSAGLFLLLMYC